MSETPDLPGDLLALAREDLASARSLSSGQMPRFTGRKTIQAATSSTADRCLRISFLLHNRRNPASHATALRPFKPEGRMGFDSLLVDFSADGRE